MEHNSSKNKLSLVIFGLILSLGLIISAFLISNSIKSISSANDIITVKGLAEKKVVANTATIKFYIKGKSTVSYKEASNLLTDNKKGLVKFLQENGFNKYTISHENLEIKNKSVPKNIGGEIIYNDEFDYYLASQYLVITSTDVKKIAYIYDKADRHFKLIGDAIETNNPDYLLSNLEEIKMSLIKGASDNAYARAHEFAKSGNIKVGPMRSAKQGSFYILSPNNVDNDDAYGGTYDKTTINKIAKVVVTIDYSIK